MSKLIIINENTAKILSFEEVFKMYKPLVKTEVIKFSNLKMDFDDRYQLASIGLWKAYEMYDGSKGISFSMLARKSISHQLRGVYTYENRLKRSGIVLMSMDEEIQGNWNVLSLSNLLESDDDIEGDLILKTNLQEFISKLTEKQKETIEWHLRGKKYNEVAEILGVGQPTISMRVKAARKIFNICMEG